MSIFAVIVSKCVSEQIPDSVLLFSIGVNSTLTQFISCNTISSILFAFTIDRTNRCTRQARWLPAIKVVAVVI